jgi:hypothetical protein
MTLESLLYVCTRTLFDERGGVGFAPSLIAEEGYIGSALFLLLLLLLDESYRKCCQSALLLVMIGQRRFYSSD